MVERATIFQGVQLGVETVPGTAVAANKKLLATSFMFSPAPEVSFFRPNGNKFNTIASLDFEMTEGDIEGQMSYTDLTYLFSSLITTDTPAASGTTGQEWVFTSDSDGPDTPKTYTIEQGSSVRAQEAAHGIITGLTLTWSNDGTEVGGTWIGKAISDGITMTAAPTEIALQPVLRTETLVYIEDDPDDLDAATPLARLLSIEWSLTDRFAPIRVINGTSTFPAVIESEPTGEITFMVQADDEGMGFLPDLRAGTTKFVRIQAIGPQIGAGPATYELTIDTAIKLQEPGELHDEDGVFAVEWTGQFVHDGTWGKAFNISLINALTAL